MNGYFRALMAIAILGMVSGCATSRSVVSIGQPYSAIDNPEKGTAVKIIQVTDARTFEASPKNPDTPSLSDDINNKSIQARAIARKRNGYGMALGDVLLPEDQTVSSMIGGALTTGFRQAHYRVLSPGDSGYDAATPVKVQVIKFWSWFQPGFWDVQIHNRTEVKITGSLPVLKNGLTVHGAADKSMMAVTEDDWQAIASQGLNDFSDNATKALGKP